MEGGSRASETERCEAPDSRAWSAPDMPGATAFCPVANPRQFGAEPNAPDRAPDREFVRCPSVRWRPALG